MPINSNLNERVVIDTGTLDWQPIPNASVWRKRLYLDGRKEAGVITSIVRFDANSVFHAHGHPDGEEIYVLDGTFSDEHGDYSAGSYLLNPDGHRHAPHSKHGCVIFVRLGQYAGRGREHITLDTGNLHWQPGGIDGITVKRLYAQRGFPERTRLLQFGPDTSPYLHDHPDGEEVYVLKGEFEDKHGCYAMGTWIRNPPGSRHSPFSRTGAVLLVWQPPR